MLFNTGKYKDSLLFRGEWDILVVGPDGTIKSEQEKVSNLIVNAGKVHLVNHLVNVATAYGMTYIAIGTGTTAAAAADTALQTEVGTRVNGTKSVVTETIANVYQVQGTFASGNPAGSNAITEAGLFSASSAGTMLNRVVFSAINKANDDSLQLTVKVTFG